MRGEGLLVGLKVRIPYGEFVDALRAEKLLTVAAGDNVVRLLPPLIVSEAEIAEAIERDRSRLQQDRDARSSGGKHAANRQGAAG